MKNLMALLKLDYKMCAPYWKWWLMFFGISLLMSLVNRDGGLFILFAAMFGMTMMAFPFEVTEKSNLDVLYAVLPTNRRSIVAARYLYVLSMLAIIMLLSAPIGLIIHAAFGNSISFSAFAVITAFSIAVFLICVGVQTPFMYKHGYKKGRIFMWIPLILFVIVFNLPGIFDLLSLDVEFNIFEILFRNELITILVSLGVATIITVLSCMLARKLYLKKDF